MSADISRRDLLKAAGGLTFLALVPVSRGRFALGSVSVPGAEPPLFTALPYVQPGDNSRLVADQERVILAWQTEATPADFRVVFGPTTQYGRTADVTVNRRSAADKEDGEARLNYTAAFEGLRLGATYHYRVTLRGERIAEGYFTTRKPRGTPTRFVAFGDNSYGDISDHAIAYHAYQARPDFVMNTRGQRLRERPRQRVRPVLFPGLQRRRGRAAARGAAASVDSVLHRDRQPRRQRQDRRRPPGGRLRRATPTRWPTSPTCTCR